MLPEIPNKAITLLWGDYFTWIIKTSDLQWKANLSVHVPAFSIYLCHVLNI